MLSGAQPTPVDIHFAAQSPVRCASAPRTFRTLSGPVIEFGGDLRLIRRVVLLQNLKRSPSALLGQFDDVEPLVARHAGRALGTLVRGT
jgi:hypothetical protein